MVNICIPLRQQALNDLHSGNLRSEARWERQALEACLVNPEVKNIFTLGYEWDGGKHTNSKYSGLASRKETPHCVLLAQDWNTEHGCRYDWQGIITNIFHGPWIEQLSDIQNVATKYKNKFVFTIGFATLYNNLSARSHLLKFLAPENIVLLPVPGVPESRYRDIFLNNTLTWAWRIIFIDTLVKAPGIHWAFKKLQQNPDLDFYILTGWEPEEVKDLINGQEIRMSNQLVEGFWRRKEVQQYLDIKSRCKIEYAISWKDILDLYARTKILLNHENQFGGPPLEAAMHGLPCVGTSLNTGALVGCPDYLVANTVDDFLSILEKLYKDHDYSLKIGKSYHDYVMATYSYEVFNKNLNIILAERGLL